MPVPFIALYGRFSSKMKPADVQNVTKALLPFLAGDTLTLPKQKSLDDLFANIRKGPKFLQIQLPGGRKINIRNDTYQFDVVINLQESEAKICIIYSVFINPKANWRALIRSQLQDIRSYGLLDEADLYIHITNEHRTGSVLSFVRRQAGAKAVINQSFANQYEYPAIKLLYGTAMQRPDNIYLYFHTKGMSHGLQKRTRQERALMAGSFENWRKNMEGFKDATVNKVGMFPAEVSPRTGGWVWYNYFMVKGNYLAGCDDPLITDKRHYYESWLGKSQGAIHMDDGYSTYTHQKENFGPHQSTELLIKYTDDWTERRKVKSFVYRLGFPWFKKRR